VLNIVLVGVKLMEGVIVIADESCGEDIVTDSLLDSFVPVLDAIVVIDVVVSGIVVSDVIVVDGVVVIIGVELVLIFEFTIDLVVVIAVVETVELLLSLFARRLLISVDVLVVGIGIDVVFGVEIKAGEDVLQLVLLLL
jgi:hypothetical protein